VPALRVVTGASALIGSAAVLLLGCSTSSHVLVGQTRAAIAPEQVKIYLQAPAKYEEVAVIEASSQGSGAFSEQEKMNAAMDRLKKEAASLGANGVLLQGTEDRHGGSIGFGVGGSNWSGGGGAAVGTGVSGEVTYKAAHGLAIYVEQEKAAAPASPP
jgi:hypothetical protein